jgi:uncharacterized protein
MDASHVEMIPAIPGTFHQIGVGDDISYERDTLLISAGPRTDWFVDPGSGDVTVNAPALIAPLRGDYTLSARLDVELACTYDAGALVLWADDHHWAKLALEFSPDGEALVVSVVTRGESDDANSIRIEADHSYLRIARIGAAYAFHVSVDGTRWRFVRHFRLDGEPEVGFEAQSPTGDGCTARFSEIAYREGVLADLRSGV